MPGAFDASQEDGFEDDPLRTAEEIQHRGEDLLRWLQAAAEADEPERVDVEFLLHLHRRWFETTFPADAGRFRTSMVLNRKGTAVPVESVLPSVTNACDNWSYRRQLAGALSPEEQIELAISEANTLTIQIYDVHPFLDGNTRTTWHLRNYLLMLDGLPPLIDLTDEDAYLKIWWASTPHDHAALDDLVLAELTGAGR